MNDNGKHSKVRYGSLIIAIAIGLVVGYVAGKAVHQISDAAHLWDQDKYILSRFDKHVEQGGHQRMEERMKDVEQQLAIIEHRLAQIEEKTKTAQE